MSTLITPIQRQTQLIEYHRRRHTRLPAPRGRAEAAHTHTHTHARVHSTHDYTHIGIFPRGAAYGSCGPHTEGDKPDTEAAGDTTGKGKPDEETTLPA
jgi:hypothetical protein